MTFQIRTMQDLDQLVAAIRELKVGSRGLAKCARLARFAAERCAGKPGAVEFAAATTEEAIDAADGLFRRFETAAVRLFGVPRDEGESALDYLERIVALTDQGLESIEMAMISRGLVLDLSRP